MTETVHFTEEEERAYLEHMLQQLEWALQQLDTETKRFSKEFREDQRYLFDQRSGMDEADVVSAGQSFKRFAHEGASGILARKKITKLIDTPYFGRIDFARDGRDKSLPIYIGIHSFANNTPGTYPIYDWRAPVSSMFYDFELGEAWYETPGGRVNGIINLRRQYRIRQGKMEYMLENAVNIQDDVLQKELSHSSDDKMKTIVATIQRDQNAIIRNETSQVMIIQGVAGSGKTSIAIHRIAFLLYRFRDDIASKDILIISPNKVFADYISNVLPELGEANIPEMGMEELAADLLDQKFSFETFLQQVTRLVKGRDEQYAERVYFKSSAEMVRQLNRYIIYLENNFLEAHGFKVGKVMVPAPFIQERFKALMRIPLLNRVPELAREIQRYVREESGHKVSGREKTLIFQRLNEMVGRMTLLDIYRNFYEWLNRSDLFAMGSNKLEYSDVFPLIYCKIRLEGVTPYHEVKHLVVDEMQDYSPIQYTVLARLFPGKKTILGDVSQSVFLHGATDADSILDVFPAADVIRLLRSYRSTYEITKFALHIKPNPDLIAMERHGPMPAVAGFDDEQGQIEAIRKIMDDFRRGEHHMLAIICKTYQQADSLYQILQEEDVYLLTDESRTFRHGIEITTVPLAKGLEFDEVIIPFVSSENYHNETDRGLLYIACTRAMHQLTVTYVGAPSKFISPGAALADVGQR